MQDESKVRALGLFQTNKDIAGRLFPSVRMAESNVRNALAKLQLTTRTELAVWVHEHRPPDPHRSSGTPVARR